MVKKEGQQLSCPVCVQWVPLLFKRLDFFYVNKSHKIECYGNKMHQIIQMMTLTPGLELKLSLLHLLF